MLGAWPGAAAAARRLDQGHDGRLRRHHAHNDAPKRVRATELDRDPLGEPARGP